METTGPDGQTQNYDQLVARGSTLKNPQDRKKVYDEAQVLLTEIEVPMIPLFLFLLKKPFLGKPYIRGFKTNAMELFI
ncbi:MAG: hypothetical protein Ct9H300mP23_07100 [Nitrospinota bacterium]|nr:MAG: hypothetical protein Ct9H300mP23_07100 [Nitrospinota bacterium]